MLEVIQVLDKMAQSIWKTFEKKMHIADDDRKGVSLFFSTDHKCLWFLLIETKYVISNQWRIQRGFRGFARHPLSSPPLINIDQIISFSWDI